MLSGLNSGLCVLIYGYRALKDTLFGLSPHDQPPQLSTEVHPELGSHFQGKIVGKHSKCGRAGITSYLVYRKRYLPAFKELALGPTVYKRNMDTALLSNAEVW